MSTMVGREPFQADPEIQDRITRLVILFLERGRGSIVSWADVERVAGGEHNESTPRHIIKTAEANLLDEYGIFAGSFRVKNVGVEIFTDVDQLRELPKYRNRRRQRQCKKQIKEVLAVDTSRMSTADRVWQLAVSNAAERELKELRRELKPSFWNRTTGTPTIPVRPILVNVDASTPAQVNSVHGTNAQT